MLTCLGYLLGVILLFEPGPIAGSTDQMLAAPPGQDGPASFPPGIHSLLDAAPDSVGILITTATEEVHVWLPIGERVYVEDHSGIPIDPLAARITHLTASTPEHDSLEELDAVRCYMYLTRGRRLLMRVVITKSVAWKRYLARGEEAWLTGGELESYHCFWRSIRVEEESMENYEYDLV